MKDDMKDEFAVSKIVDRSAFQSELDKLRVREKARTNGRPAAQRSRLKAGFSGDPGIGKR
jgi:hypothetical protein